MTRGPVAAIAVILVFVASFAPTLAQLPTVDASTIDRKVIAGYQGWFSCPNDEARSHAWRHWLNPDGSLAIDMLPDVSELPISVRCKVDNIDHPDGSPVYVFSSRDAATVRLHFRWMREYGIDGIALQKFVNGLKDGVSQRETDRVVDNVRTASEAEGRTFFLMYDISGASAQSWRQDVEDDWSRMVSEVDPENWTGC